MIFIHLQDISRKYPEDTFLAGCHRVIEIEGKEIVVALDTAKWTKVMDDEWEIHPAQPTVCTIILKLNCSILLFYIITM